MPGDSDVALLRAARYGDLDDMRRAVAAGGDINAKDMLGRTAAMAAARSGHLPCLEYAVTAGGDIDAKNNKGRTAAMVAASEGHTAIVEWLKGGGPARAAAAAAAAARVPQLERDLAAREADIARLRGELEQASSRVREAEAAAVAGCSPLPAFLQRAVASIGEYMADGGLAGAGLAARRGVVGSLREAAAEEAVRVAAAEWREGSGDGSMREVAEAMAARDAAVASEVAREGMSAWGRAQMQELQEVFKQSKQLMKQCVARRRVVAAADEAADEARMMKGRLRRARLRGEAVEEAAMASAAAAIAAAEEELREAQGSLERVLQAMREVQAVCPEVECKLSWQASADDGLEAVAELGDAEEAALLASISERVGRVLLGDGEAKAEMADDDDDEAGGKALVEWQYEVENGKWVAYSEEEGRALEAAWLGEREAVALGGGREVRLAGADGAVEVRSSGNGDGGRRVAVRRLAKSG